MADYSKMTPPEVWKLIRTGEITRPTAGMCAGYAQANLVILPKKYADDFKEFARKNPKPCPILEVVEGTPDIHDMGEGASIVTDIPKYFIYRDGVKVDEVTDVSSYWKEDSVAFLIGCSFSFEEALMKAGIEVRHIAQGCTGPSIPLYKNLPKAPITASKAAFAVRFLIHDKPGVLAAIAAGQQEKNAQPQANRRYGRDEGYPGFCFHRAVTSRGKIYDSIGSIAKVNEKRKKKSQKLLDFFFTQC